MKSRPPRLEFWWNLPYHFFFRNSRNVSPLQIFSDFFLVIFFPHCLELSETFPRFEFIYSTYPNYWLFIIFFLHLVQNPQQHPVEHGFQFRSFGQGWDVSLNLGEEIKMHFDLSSYQVCSSSRNQQYRLTCQHIWTSLFENWKIKSFFGSSNISVL